MERGEYLVVMGLCLLITLPLELLLGARVWRRPRRLPRHPTGWGAGHKFVCRNQSPELNSRRFSYLVPAFR